MRIALQYLLLAVDEVGDFELVQGFFLERVRSLWPFSMWAFVWSLYRALYHVMMALVLILFIDRIWYEPNSAGEGAVTVELRNATSANGATRMLAPDDVDDVSSNRRIVEAGILSVLVVLGKSSRVSGISAYNCIVLAGMCNFADF